MVLTPQLGCVVDLDVLSNVFGGDGNVADRCRNSVHSDVLASEAGFGRKAKEREVTLDKLDDSHPEEITQLAIVFRLLVQVDDSQQLLDPQPSNVQAKQRRIFGIHGTLPELAEGILEGLGVMNVQHFLEPRPSDSLNHRFGA